MGAQISVSSAAVPKLQSLAEIGFHGTLFLSSTKFFFEIADRFYLVNLVGNVKMH